MRARVTDEPVTLRARQASDRAALRRIAAAAFEEYSWRGGRGASELVERLETVIVACCGREVVGFVSLERVAPHIAAIPAIAVDEGARGNGVGRRLLGAAERVARERGARLLTLHTAQANLAAFELFTRNGYRIERRIPRYYRGVFDACEMRKSL